MKLDPREIPIIYAELCPACSGDLTVEEIKIGKCKHTNKIIGYTELNKSIKEFSRLFKEFVGSDPRELQILWAKRILERNSFAAIAPTGIGKTTFGMVIAIYFASKGKKVYSIVPTTPLVMQFYERVEKFIRKKNLNIRVVSFHSELKSTEKNDIKKCIESGNFDILVTTTQFLTKNYHLLHGKFFDFIYVDDVDSLLRASKNINKVLELLNFSREEIRKEMRSPDKNYGILMVSTATGKKGRETRILRKLLNFDVGNVRDVVRNVEDIFYGEKNLSNLLEILNKFGHGGIIYATTTTEAEEVYEFLKSNGFKVGIVTGDVRKSEHLKLFSEGTLRYLVGVSAPYGALIRGIDFPEQIRYVVFYGLPIRTYNVRNLRSMPEGLIRFLARVVLKINVVRKSDLEKIIDELEKALSLENSNRIYGDIIYRNGLLYVPDTRTYIQGSGRSSRMYSGGITKGASIILDSAEILECFRKRLRIFDISIKNIQDVDINKLNKEIDGDRKKLKQKHRMKEVYSPLLFVVESPNKARHIASFFGKPNVRIYGKATVYEVPIGRYVVTIAPTLGHLVDLSTSRESYGIRRSEVKKGNIFIPVYSYIRKCNNCSYQFTDGERCPICGSDNFYSAKDQINLLRKLAFECGKVIIGTDPDTEGEKIAWDVYMLLKGYGKEIRRVEFHEVTPTAIIEAINNPRDFNLNLVKAQIVRRIEDRWIGFKLSEILQKWLPKVMEARHEDEKLKEKIKNIKRLSAGRVQTPPLGWIIDRYYEKKTKFVEIKDFDIWLEYDKKIDKIRVEVLNEVEKEVPPPPPYTTDTLLKDANRVLKFSAAETMNLAQELFEIGWITYHRTDSTTVSERGLHIAREYLGDKFVGRTYAMEGAHECIRPTRPLTSEDLSYLAEELVHIKIHRRHLMLYDLIFRRFMASQMKPAKITVQKVKYIVDNKEFSEERVVDFKDGFKEIYHYEFRVKKRLENGEYSVESSNPKKFRKVGLYTQAELIAEMKSRGIGRPSTYASIIEKLLRKGYVVEKNGRLIPLWLGIEVYKFLNEHFKKLVSEETTRELELMMKRVEDGQEDYQKILMSIHEEIEEIIKKEIENIDSSCNKSKNL